MIYTDKEFCLEVWGPSACFTRPELKVERVSYDVPTPSAVRAIFEAILFKRYAMRWEVTRIEVLNPIRWESVRRNEVGATASKPQKGPIFIEEKRQQRNTLQLRDVRYRFWARLVFIPVSKRPKEAFTHHAPGNDENPEKYNEMFRRRASLGQCFTQPYLGTRECAANFRLVDSDSKASLTPAIHQNCDLGLMLHDIDFSDPSNPMPTFYLPTMKNGVIEVPHPDSSAIFR